MVSAWSGRTAKGGPAEKRRAVLMGAAAMAAALTGCAKHPASPAAATNASAPAPAAAVAAPPAADAPNLLSLTAGAFPLVTPDSAAWHTGRDLLGGSDWSSQYHAKAPAIFVIALPQRTVLKTLSFDGGGIGSAKDVTVEMSDQPEAGFAEIAKASLDEYAKNQTVAAERDVAGRFMRLTIVTDYDPEGGYWMSLGGLRATGVQLSNDPQADVSGTYAAGQTPDGVRSVHLRQEGTAITGCMENPKRTFEGSIENHAAKVSWCTNCAAGDADTDKGTAVLAFSPKADRLVGLGWSKADPTRPDPTNGFYEGSKSAADVGTCPNWSGGIEQQLASDIADFGRATVHGVNFDVDSDRIRDDSKPLLDQIAAMLKAHADWRIDVEGHTDSTSTHAHNQALSDRRAASVKAYLVGAGVAGDHLTSQGFGDAKPIADNTTDLGRAQNRRVELVKE